MINTQIINVAVTNEISRIFSCEMGGDRKKLKTFQNRVISIQYPELAIVRNRNLLTWKINGFSIFRLEEISYVRKQIPVETGAHNKNAYRTSTSKDGLINAIV